MTAGRTLSDLVIGSVLELGGFADLPAQIEFKGSTPGAIDASLLVEGTLEILGSSSFQDVTIVSGSIGTPGGSDELQIHANTHIHTQVFNFIDGPTSGDPVTGYVDPATGNASFGGDLEVGGSLSVGGTDLVDIIQDEISGSAPTASVLVPNIWMDQTLHAVPGQADTFYIDKGATSHGYNVKTHPSTSRPIIHLYVQGQKQLEGVNYQIVRSLSTGPEGPAAVGSLNAIQFLGALAPLPSGADFIFYDYLRDTEAAA